MLEFVQQKNFLNAPERVEPSKSDIPNNPFPSILIGRISNDDTVATQPKDYASGISYQIKLDLKIDRSVGK